MDKRLCMKRFIAELYNSQSELDAYQSGNRQVIGLNIILLLSNSQDSQVIRKRMYYQMGKCRVQSRLYAWRGVVGRTVHSNVDKDISCPEELTSELLGEEASLPEFSAHTGGGCMVGPSSDTPDYKWKREDHAGEPEPAPAALQR